MKDVIKAAIKDLGGASILKKLDYDELYGELESTIDGLLYEPEYQDYRYEDGETDTELLLEKLVFRAIKKIKCRRHKCDPSYDDAFEGYDCASKQF